MPLFLRCITLSAIALIASAAAYAGNSHDKATIQPPRPEPRSSAPQKAIPTEAIAFFFAFYRKHAEIMPNACKEAGVDVSGFQRAFISLNAEMYDYAQALSRDWQAQGHEAVAPAQNDAELHAEVVDELNEMASVDSQSRGGGCGFLFRQFMATAQKHEFRVAFPERWRAVTGAADAFVETQCVRRVDVSAPRYPLTAQLNRQQGVVAVKVSVAEDGAVSDSVIAATSGWPAIDTATLAQSRHWKFDVSACPDPRRREGYVMWVPLTFAFPDDFGLGPGHF